MFDDVIELLGFESYAPRPVVARIRRRMGELGVIDISAYEAILRADVRELDAMHAAVPNEYTKFFRDPASWQLLEHKLLPRLLMQKEHVRIWSAGCSTGEEAYSLAILLVEQLGFAEAARRVTIFAGDVSASRLDHAREGRFGVRATAAVPALLRARYFSGERIEPKLRALIRFCRHDILSDPPFVRMDLVACRNVLLYLRPLARGRAVAKLHIALAAGGVLFTGPADGLAAHRRVFRSLGGSFYDAPRVADRTDILAACRRG